MFTRGNVFICEGGEEEKSKRNKIASERKETETLTICEAGLEPNHCPQSPMHMPNCLFLQWKSSSASTNNRLVEPHTKTPEPPRATVPEPPRATVPFRVMNRVQNIVVEVSTSDTAV